MSGKHKTTTVQKCKSIEQVAGQALLLDRVMKSLMLGSVYVDSFQFLVMQLIIHDQQVCHFAFLIYCQAVLKISVNPSVK